MNVIAIQAGVAHLVAALDLGHRQDPRGPAASHAQRSDRIQLVIAAYKPGLIRLR